MMAKTIHEHDGAFKTWDELLHLQQHAHASDDDDDVGGDRAITEHVVKRLQSGLQLLRD